MNDVIISVLSHNSSPLNLVLSMTSEVSAEERYILESSLPW